MTGCGRGADSATPECFGRGSQGTIFVRSSKFFSFQSYFHFEELFPRALIRFGAECSSSGVFGFGDASELFFFFFWTKVRFVTMIFLRTLNTTDSNFENFLNFFKGKPVSLAWQRWWSPGWARHFRDGTSKLDLGVGDREIERRILRRIFGSSSRSVRVDCGDPWSKREKTQRSQNWCDSAKYPVYPS